MNAVRAAKILLLFWSGFSIMALELLSSNLMAPYFGASVYVWGSIIGTFMVHMSLGYVLGGYLARRFGRLAPLPLMALPGFAWLLLLPYMVGPLGDRVSEAVDDARLGSLIVMNILFAVPVVLAAMTSPYVIELNTVGGDRFGLRAGPALFISTGGSFVGTIATSFYLIDLMPISEILRMLGLTGLVVCGLIATLRPDARLEAAPAPAERG